MPKFGDVSTALAAWAELQMLGDSAVSLRRTLDQISGLPGLKEWIPVDDGMHLLDVLCLGATLSRVDKVACAILVDKVAKAILANGNPAREDMAELAAAALFAEWANQVRCIPTKKGLATPDFECAVEGGSIELEVTNSDAKQEQTVRKESGRVLAARLSALPGDSGFRVRFVDELSTDEIEAICACAGQLLTGASCEVPGRWYVEAVAPNVVPVPPTQQPVWWQPGFATPALMQANVTVAMEGAEPKVASRNIDIQWMLSTDSYINSLSKKKDAKQASGTKPFVIACNVTQLPGAFKWYEANLMPYLQSWSPAISGVVLMSSGIGELNSLHWRYKFFANPNATMPLSSAMTIPDSGQVTVPFYS